jgi:[protein-PII] uridylyltransferase
VERHLRGFQNDSYMAIFTSEEIAQHIRASRAAETVVTLFSHAEGYTEVTVIARDAPFALSHFCGVLSANDANIFDANIFTRNDGVIIDRFRVSSASSGRQIEQRVCTKIAAEMTQVQNGTIDVEHLFHEHHRKWKRRPKASINPRITTDVRFEDTPSYTIIDVFAPDSVGFLYRVTRAISQLGLDIYFAKIATRVDGIVDAFYVLDRSGELITESDRQQHIRVTLLHTIKSIQELVPE